MPIPPTFNIYSMTPEEKSRKLVDMIFAGSLEPFVRMTAVRLVQTARRDDHAERLARLHRFVRDAIPYHREPIEMFHLASEVLAEGGDCDDHVILLGSFAWALRYPFAVVKHGGANNPGGHYSISLGSPPSDEPSGDEQTEWFEFETTIDALPGESTQDALRRIEG